MSNEERFDYADVVAYQLVCPDCDGGLLYAPVRFCPRCNGDGLLVRWEPPDKAPLDLRVRS